MRTAHAEASLNVLRVSRCAALCFRGSGFRGAWLAIVLPRTVLKTNHLPTRPRSPLVRSLFATIAIVRCLWLLYEAPIYPGFHKSTYFFKKSFRQTHDFSSFRPAHPRSFLRGLSTLCPLFLLVSWFLIADFWFLVKYVSHLWSVYPLGFARDYFL